jgi:type IV secretion/conjugal transfer VirB4 family ATPase
MQNLRTAHDKSHDISELLNYAALVDDGVVLNKDGSFLAAFSFHGIDVSSATPDERNRLSRKINQALSSLGTGYMTHVDAVRRKVVAYSDREDSHFPHPVFAAIDERRRAFFSGDSDKFETVCTLTVTYLPPSKSLSKLTQWVFEQDGVTRGSAAQRNLQRFNEKLRDLEGRLGEVVPVRRLRAVKVGELWQCELLAHLNSAVLGVYHPVTLPETPMFLDNLTGNYDFWVGMSPKLDKEYISCISLDGFPNQSSPNMLMALNYLNVEYRWSTRFCFYDSTEAISLLEKEQKKWKQKVVSFKDKLLRNPNPKVDEDALDMVRQYEAAITAASRGDVKYGHYTAVVLVRHSDIATLEADAEEVAKVLRNLMGFSCRIETVNATEAFLGSLPGDSLHNVRRPLLSTQNLSHMLPLSSIWAGEEFNPCPFYPPRSPALMYCTAEGHAPFRLNLHVSDLGHTLIFGPPGSGKSTLLAMLVSQFMRYPGANVFAFDKGRSMYAVSQCGGVHFEIGNTDESLGSTSPCFAPLADLDNDFAWCAEYLEKLLLLHDVVVDPPMRSEIHAALTRLRGGGSPTMTDFVVQVQNDLIKEALAYYTMGNRGGDLLDGTEDDIHLTHLQVYELEELMKRGEKDLIPVLLYLFRKIERSLTGQPAVIVIDEAWMALSHPVFRAMILEWLKVLRKANCIVILATQSLSDAVKSGMLDVLVESCPTTIFLPNPKATQENILPIYQSFGLNHRQITLINEARQKRQYYVTSPIGNRLMDLSLSPLELAFVGVSDKAELRSLRQCIDENGESWYVDWLETKGVSIEQYF